MQRAAAKLAPIIVYRGTLDSSAGAGSLVADCVLSVTVCLSSLAGICKEIGNFRILEISAPVKNVFHDKHILIQIIACALQLVGTNLNRNGHIGQDIAAPLESISSDPPDTIDVIASLTSSNMPRAVPSN